MKDSQDVITQLGADLLMFSSQFLRKLFDFRIKPGSVVPCREPEHSTVCHM